MMPVSTSTKISCEVLANISNKPVKCMITSLEQTNIYFNPWRFYIPECPPHVHWCSYSGRNVQPRQCNTVELAIVFRKVAINSDCVFNRFKPFLSVCLRLFALISLRMRSDENRWKGALYLDILFIDLQHVAQIKCAVEGFFVNVKSVLLFKIYSVSYPSVQDWVLYSTPDIQLLRKVRRRRCLIGHQNTLKRQ